MRLGETPDETVGFGGRFRGVLRLSCATSDDVDIQRDEMRLDVGIARIAF